MGIYTNIDRFNHIAGVLLEAAYDTFPQRCQVEISDIVHSFPAGMREQAEENLVTSDDIDVIGATAQWLEAEGFVRGLRTDTFSTSFILSLKGFTTLSRMPAALEQTFGERLSESVREGGWDTVRSLVPELLRVGFMNGIGA